MMRRLTLVPVVAAAVLLSVTGCKPEPEPDSVDVVGDSIALQATLAGSGLPGEPPDLETHAGNGWTAADVLPWVEDQVASGRPETLVIALGVNDAKPGNGGWGWSDIATWVDLLDAPHPDACVVVVLPAVGEGASAELAAEVDTARTDITNLASQRDGPTVVEDWGIVTDADPSVLSTDGVHLAPDPAGPWGISSSAAEAATGLWWQATHQCPTEAPR